jgi:hypothetical protein
MMCAKEVRNPKSTALKARTPATAASSTLLTFVAVEHIEAVRVRGPFSSGKKAWRASPPEGSHREEHSKKVLAAPPWLYFDLETRTRAIMDFSRYRSGDGAMPCMAECAAGQAKRSKRLSPNLKFNLKLLRHGLKS